jgi:phenylpropionate dioxygenase-like ring-hydroxylating dioxygenase large terminal subunit
MGENLVLFRDEHNRIGLLGLQCAHRGADLSYGRIEGGGLRCLYHGWVYATNGQCLEQPGEPPESTFHDRVRQLSYPCVEKGGLIFAYLGQGEPPVLPAYEALQVPDEYRFVFKMHSRCNYLQASEGNIDPVHLSFLHRMSEEVVRARRRAQYSTVSTAQGAPAKSSNALFGSDVSPVTELEETDFGFRISSFRRLGEEQGYLRVSNFIMPNLCAVPGETLGAGYHVNWLVPIDDESHWRYVIFFSREGPLDQAHFRDTYYAEIDENWRPRRNLANRYQQEREEMQDRIFSGMGTWFHTHDLFATESAGPLYDRSQERVGYSDKAVILMRRQLLRAIKDMQAGRDPLHVVRDDTANDFGHVVVVSQTIPAAEDAWTYWRTAQKAQAVFRASLGISPDGVNGSLTNGALEARSPEPART